MRNPLRLFCGAIALVAMLTAVACGGGGEEMSGSRPADPADSEMLVTNPSEALGASAERFEEEVESVQADFTFEFGVEGITVGANGHFVFQAPDSVHMTMEMSGGDGTFDAGEFGPIEMLLLGDQIYMKTGFTGWMTMSLDDLGEDAQSFRDMMDFHSPLDYQALVDSLGAEVENLGPVDVGGNTYTRLRITTDLASVLNAMADSAGEDTLAAALFGVSGPMTMDILMNPETMLPYTFEADGSFGIGAESMDFKMAFKFYDYNKWVHIPAPPEDAVPFDEGFGSLDFGEELSSSE
jgi:hypothetical protein